MVSKLASVNFNALIKILSNASKLDCQAAVLNAGLRFWSPAGLFEQAAFLCGSQAGLATFNVLFIHFRWDGGDSISPDCPWDVAQNKTAGLWYPPPEVFLSRHVTMLITHCCDLKDTGILIM